MKFSLQEQIVVSLPAVPDPVIETKKDTTAHLTYTYNNSETSEEHKQIAIAVINIK